MNAPAIPRTSGLENVKTQTGFLEISIQQKCIQGLTDAVCTLCLGDHDERPRNFQQQRNAHARRRSQQGLQRGVIRRESARSILAELGIEQ